MIAGARGPLCIIRAPFSYRYSVLSVAEEPIITYLLGYFEAIGFTDYEVHDFHLERGTLLEPLLARPFDDYLLPIRETGENLHYVRRIAARLAAEGKRVWIYGQVARLRKFQDWHPNVTIVQHDERQLARALGLPDDGPDFAGGLTARPYLQSMDLAPWQVRRARAALETTRGCHFGCSFCFINQGRNYPQRWQVRPNDAVIADLKRYCDLGIRNFVFYDSEFIGKDDADIPAKVDLLQRIIGELPRIRFKIYCRADTLLRFDRFELLKQAGLVQVFVGAESFAQEDLDALNKQLTSRTVVDAVRRLQDLDIYANLSFIVFNRNTSTRTIRHNIDVLEDLARTKARLLGVPAFTFSFESDWRGNRTAADTGALSGKTYVIHDLKQKEQPLASAQIFHAELEPLMELYRLLSYEWSKKLVTLNLARDNAAADEKPGIEAWCEGLTAFCLRTQRRYLDLFEEGLITLDRLDVFRDRLFADIGDYYAVLPARYRSLETYDEHAVSMDYQADSGLVEDDEYWSAAIPR